ncbi:hypothetical protein MHYP_G00172850 [Metynnis hypsauchen]
MSPVHQTKDPIQQKAQPSGKHLKDCTSKSFAANKPSELVGRPVYPPQPLRNTTVHQKLKVPQVVLVPLSSCPVDNVPNVTLKQAHAPNHSKPEAQQTTNKVNSPYPGQQGQTGRCAEENRLQLRSAPKEMLEKTNKGSCRYCKHCHQTMRSHYKKGDDTSVQTAKPCIRFPVISLMHTDSRPFSCPVCKTGFRTKANVQAHLKTHEKTSEERKKGMRKRKRKLSESEEEWQEEDNVEEEGEESDEEEDEHDEEEEEVE